MPGVPPGSVSTPGDNTGSLRSFVTDYRIVVVAKPIEITGVYNPTPGGTPYTIFQMEVASVAAGEDRVEGSRMDLLIEGGPMADGTVIPLRDPPELGRMYLFLLADARYLGFPGFGAPSYTRFEVSDEGYVIPNGLEGSPGLREISGITQEEYEAAVATGAPKEALKNVRVRAVDEAVKAIQAALAEGPVPPYPEWWGDTPTPSPEAVTPTPAPSPSSEPTASPTASPAAQ